MGCDWEGEKGDRKEMIAIAKVNDPCSRRDSRVEVELVEVFLLLLLLSLGLKES
jgi:hypothetical protein